MISRPSRLDLRGRRRSLLSPFYGFKELWNVWDSLPLVHISMRKDSEFAELGNGTRKPQDRKTGRGHRSQIGPSGPGLGGRRGDNGSGSLVTGNFENCEATRKNGETQLLFLCFPSSSSSCLLSSFFPRRQSLSRSLARIFGERPEKKGRREEVRLFGRYITYTSRPSCNSFIFQYLSHLRPTTSDSPRPPQGNDARKIRNRRQPATSIDGHSRLCSLLLCALAAPRTPGRPDFPGSPPQQLVRRKRAAAAVGARVERPTRP